MYIEITPDDYRVQFRYQSEPDYGSEIIDFAKLKQDLVVTLTDDAADKTFADIAFAIAHDVTVILNDTYRKVYARLFSYVDGEEYTFEAIYNAGRALWKVTSEDVWSYELTPISGGGTLDHRELEHRDAANQHPMTAITGLEDALDGKQPSGDYALTEELDALAEIVEDKYEKPSSGIPKNDLSEGVQSSLDKADTALQEHQSLAAYRTASAQDAIDNAAKARLTAIEAKEADWDGKADPEDIPEVVDSVTSTAAGKSLSAHQGKLLNDRINNIAGRGRFLSLWNAATGMPLTNPSGYPYEYRTGDFFIVSTVGDTNYIPNGDTYEGEPSTTVYTGTLKTNDTIFYDGSTWSVFDTPVGTGDLLDVFVNGSSVVVDGVAYVLVPTTLAGLTGDSTHRTVTDAEKSTWDGKGTYSKPSTGIPKTDMASAVQTSLGRADSALQSVPDTYRTASAQDAIDATKLSDAPADGKQYARENGAWAEVTGGTSLEWLTDAEINAMFED